MSFFEGMTAPKTGGEPWGVVPNSAEMQRIMRMPRRFLDLDKQLIDLGDGPEAIPDCTRMFRRPGGAMTFRPVQSVCLLEAAIANGALFQVGVGDGKTLITLCLPDVMDSRRAVLLVPPNLKAKTIRDMARYSQHFNLPLDRIDLVTYWELSNADQGDVLERLQPDLVIADECQELRHRSAARTKRFLRYFRANPGTRFVGLSGSTTKHSVVDYAHLLELALGKNSPLPEGYRELQDWAGALDAKPLLPMKPGALLKLCVPGEEVRDGYRRRLRETRGVVVTSQSKLDVALRVRRLDLHVPMELEAFRQRVIKTWALADEEFQDQLMLTRALRQLSAGFYYRWSWPGEPDHEWIDARRNWHREVRTYLAHSSRPGMDSPELLKRAARSGTWKSEAWPAWSAVADRPEPPVEPVWLSDFLVEVAVKWAEENSRGSIIWYEHGAIGRALEDALQVPRYGAGEDAETATEPLILCSIKAQGTGKNLQHRYSKNLITTLPSSGDTFEQLVGRTHREGQPEHEVSVDWFGHTLEMHAAWSNILQDAEYVEQTQGTRQRVLYADVI